METDFFRWDDLFAHPNSRKIFFQLKFLLVRCRKINILTTPSHTSMRFNETLVVTQFLSCVGDLFLLKRAFLS